jgi:carbonic anhydrase
MSLAPVHPILEVLAAGNRRYVAGNNERPHQSVARRVEVAAGQRPMAVVLTCADSRVPPELIFDRGIGDLFVMRVAGNCDSEGMLASTEYAVEYLGVPVVLVLGHSGCGAMAAVVHGRHAVGHLPGLLAAIEPAVTLARGRAGDPVDQAAQVHVGLVVERLQAAQPVLAPRVAAGTLTVAGGFYDLRTGLVELI